MHQERDRVKALMLTLKGAYHLTRTVSTPHLSMEGRADFVHVSKNRMHYYERGSYVLNDALCEFYQERYFICETVCDEVYLKILTPKETVLHQVKLSDLKPPSYAFSHIHLCGQDNYRLHFKREDTTILMRYDIDGPFKDYAIETRLEKM